MAASDHPAAEEAIDALLQEHARVITGDLRRGKVETQFQYLERKLNALESQLGILKEANQAKVDADGSSLGVVPVPQALKIHEWCWQERIERIATTLNPGQINLGRIMLSDQLQRRILLLEEQLPALRQQRNRRLPIARLPLEILIQVFEFVLSAQPPEWRDETFILCTVLMRICRDWTRIIQNTPGLWNRISPYSSSLCQVMVALNKSRPCPLSVWFNSAQMRHIRPGRFLESITEHVDRWEVLELHLIGRDPRIILNSRLGRVFPPRLRRLRVSMEPTGVRSPFHDSKTRLFGGCWPGSLRHFGLVGCSIDPSRSTELQGLVTLEISQLPSQQEVRVAEILQILSNCPGLEKLTLSGGILLDKPPISGIAPPKPRPPVRLNQLREISLSLEPAPMNALLRSMELDNCAQFSVEAIQPPESESAWSESLLTEGVRPFIRALESVLSSASAISIEVYEDLVELSTDPPESDFVVRLTFRGTGLAEVGRWLADSLTLGTAPVTLYFEIDDAAWMETLPLILSNLDNIVMLTFVGLDATYQHAIDFLGTTIHTETTGHQHFPAQRLACMDVRDEYIPNIIHMTERRQAADVADDIRPVKLSWLILRRDLYGESTENETTGRLISALAGIEVEWSTV
ncbi:hypothetical protein FRC05_003810 [Tulasnella sp. 425]|nr:hypothetical protein FRC05_003810 [Tulasnella sp. 425]